MAAGTPVPNVTIIDDAALNCMAAGSRPSDATIALTSGLIAALNRQELQAVAAHELAHIINGDLRLTPTWRPTAPTSALSQTPCYTKSTLSKEAPPEASCRWRASVAGSPR